VIKKRANCKLIDMEEISSENNMIKMASSNINVLNSSAHKIIQSEMTKHPTALFFRAKSIVADETNSNGDYFSRDELKKSYQTFVGVPFFTNHNNQNVEDARGKIIYADWNDKDNAVYVVGFVDREAYPHICRGIEEDYMRGVSMGALGGDAVITMGDKSEKIISDVKIGDVVLSAYGNPKKVSNVHEEFLGKQMYKFDLVTYHKSPLFTEDHPIFSLDKCLIATEKKLAMKAARHNLNERFRERTGEFIGQDFWRNKEYSANFRQAATISIDDYILIPSKFNICDGASANSDLYYIIGAYLGDGYLRKNKKGEFDAISFCLGMDDIELAKKITDIIKKYTKANPDTLICEERNGLYINFYDKVLANWFYKNLGTGSKCKRIKLDIKFKEDAINLLAGYLDTDGCVAKHKNSTATFQYSSANLGLLEDVQSLLISLNAISRISKMERKPGQNSVVKINTTEYTLSIGSNNHGVFNKSIKYSKNNCIGSQINAGKSFVTTINGKNYMACPVKNVETIDFKEPVYDLTVEDDENYIADGIAVHNCSVDYSVCSICKNKADSVDNYCAHIKNRKGRKFSGTAKNVNTGEIKTFKDAPVYEENYGIKFIELSGVADPACKSCKIGDVFDNKNYLQKAASVSNNIYMYKESSLYKDASQEDIDQLNQVLTTLENLSVALVQNRQQVDVEFASDLVKILSELQEFTDELTGAGYAQVQGKAQEIPGVELEQTPEQTPETPPSAEPQAVPTQPVGAEIPPAMGKTEIESISPTVTGEPSKPRASAPRMPTGPAKPIAETIIGLKKLAEQIIESKGDNEDMNRRLPKTVQSQQNEVMNVLEKSLKEKGQILKYNEQDINNDNGGIKMSQKIASREEGAEVITEAQLESQKSGYHPRKNEPRTEITQAQLDGKRNNDEKEVLTEKQLEGKRTENSPEVITQKQLDEKRTGDEKTQITQGQLEDEGYRANKETEVITEKQLEDKTDFWKRSAFNRKEIKTGKEHVNSVISVLADTAIDCSSTPEQIVSTIGDLASSIKSKTTLLDNITVEKSDIEKEIISSSSRMKYWGKKGIKIAEMTKDNLGEIITSKLNILVAKDSKVDPEYIVDVLDSLSDSKAEAIAKIASVIDSKLAEGDTVEEVKSRKDEIREALKSEKASVDESKVKREGERKEIVDSMKKQASIAKKASHIIQTSLDEIGLDKNSIVADKVLAKKIIAGFAQGACVSNKIKLAGITNVKIDEKGRVDIAISTEGEEDQQVEVSLPPSEDEIMPSETVPEGDIAGEGLDNMVGETPADLTMPPPAAAPAPSAPAPQVPPIGAKSKVNIKKIAQIPNQAPGMGMGGQPNPALPVADPQPAMGEAVQSLTTDEPEAGIGEADSPGQFPAGSKCPFCGSSDVDVGGKGKESGFCSCNDCGAEYEISVNIEVLNPAEMSFEEEGGEKIPEPKEPQLPEMPVAASIKLNKDTIVKLASLEKSKGYVCPSCGQTECKPTVKVAGHVACVCPACETKFEHDASINVNNPEEGVLNITWKLDPK